MTEDCHKHRPALSLIGLTGAFGLFGAAALISPAPALAAQLPTFNRIPIATGYDADHPITLSGTAQAGDVVTLYEEAYVYGAKDTKAQLAKHPANDYSHSDTGPWPALTTKADSSGHWSIKRPLDSGHIMMVGTDDGYSNRRYAAVRVVPELKVTSSADNTAAFTVTVNPGEPTLPVTIQRYTNGGWTKVVSGRIGESPISYTATATGQPGGTPAYRAWISTGGDWADPENFVVAGYSATTKVTVAGTAGSTPAPTGATPVPAPTWTDPDQAATPSAPAVGSVRFTRIRYNAAGTDTRKNASVNGEYVRLTNKTRVTTTLTGWTVRDRAGNTYTFSTFRLGAGKSVLIRTGKGSNTASTRFWGRTGHIWNNGGDAATLRSSGGKTIDTCSWSSAGRGYTAC
ncbi:lamin tail domain-containing protein [Actinoplanes awajinensis]|uniref:lamin tail domain-containing protein n=1 Tax=Actinoplanes awajinensis TaxID=135946 RepID=UPI000B26F966|nr:lamin tail domain-containing protein [Actinoplanes awajinensis]